MKVYRLPIIDLLAYSKDCILVSETKIVCSQAGKIYGSITGGFLEIIQPRSEIALVRNAVVSPDSDIVLVEDRGTVIGAIWEKSKSPNFHRTLPMDWNLVTRGQHFDGAEHLTVLLHENCFEHKGAAISLLKTHDRHWGHAILEYVPSLIWCIRNEIPGDILINDATDSIIVEIIELLIRKEGDKRQLIRIPGRTFVRVENLYVVPWAAAVSNHAVSAGVLDNLITDWAVEAIDWLRDLLRREFTSPAVYTNLKKIFLSNSSSVRAAINRDDVVKEFERRGYIIIEDARLLKGRPMRLPDKMQIFSGLGHLSGFSGSSYFNLLFTSPRVRGVMIGPSLRAAEFLTASGIFRNAEIEFFPCAELRSDPHSEFYVPMTRLITYLDSISQMDLSRG
jgi:hypothetical protein